MLHVLQLREQSERCWCGTGHAASPSQLPVNGCFCFRPLLQSNSVPRAQKHNCAEAGATPPARALQVQCTEGSHCACALIGTERNSHGLPPALSLQEYSDAKHFFFPRGMVVWNWRVSERVSKSGDLCPVCTSRLMGWDSGLDFQNVLTNGLLERGSSLVLSKAGRAAGKQLFKKFLVQENT